ncbi:hypothetical protein EO93_04465 [Methanosarcina sp. 1.H.A.2.2]|nr:hypothetical protein EO93_04465 [Methanosarcina sp. 1.H.A.2.2]
MGGGLVAHIFPKNIFKPRAGFSGAPVVAFALRPRQPSPNQLRAIPLSHQGTVAVRASPKYSIDSKPKFFIFY